MKSTCHTSPFSALILAVRSFVDRCSAEIVDPSGISLSRLAIDNFCDHKNVLVLFEAPPLSCSILSEDRYISRWPPTQRASTSLPDLRLTSWYAFHSGEKTAQRVTWLHDKPAANSA